MISTTEHHTPSRENLPPSIKEEKYTKFRDEVPENSEAKTKPPCLTPELLALIMGAEWQKSWKVPEA
jgi:hypothetical protein